MFGVILDSGCCIRSYQHKGHAKAFMRKYNAKAREMKQAGEMVTPRYAIGIAWRKR